MFDCFFNRLFLELWGGGFFVFGFLVWWFGLKPFSEKGDLILSAREASELLGSLVGCLCVQWCVSCNVRPPTAALLPVNGPKPTDYNALVLIEETCPQPKLMH